MYGVCVFGLFQPRSATNKHTFFFYISSCPFNNVFDRSTLNAGAHLPKPVAASTQKFSLIDAPDDLLQYQSMPSLIPTNSSTAAAPQTFLPNISESFSNNTTIAQADIRKITPVPFSGEFDYRTADQFIEEFLERYGDSEEKDKKRIFRPLMGPKAKHYLFCVPKDATLAEHFETFRRLGWSLSRPLEETQRFMK